MVNFSGNATSTETWTALKKKKHAYSKLQELNILFALGDNWPSHTVLRKLLRCHSEVRALCGSEKSQSDKEVVSIEMLLVTRSQFISCHWFIVIPHHGIWRDPLCFVNYVFLPTKILRFKHAAGDDVNGQRSHGAVHFRSECLKWRLLGQLCGTQRYDRSVIVLTMDSADDFTILISAEISVSRLNTAL